MVNPAGGQTCFSFCIGQSKVQGQRPDCSTKLEQLRRDSHNIFYDCSLNPKTCEKTVKAFNKQVIDAMVDCMRNPPAGHQKKEAVADELSQMSQKALLALMQSGK